MLPTTFPHASAGKIFLITCLAAGAMSTLKSQELWSFEQEPAQENLFPLQPLPRPDANALKPADPAVASRTSSKSALSNPALMFDGEVTPLEIDKKSWTLSGWFRNAVPSGSMAGVQCLVGTRQSPSKFLGWDLNMVDGTLRFMTAPPRGQGRQFATGKRYDDGRWHFFQLIWNAEAREVTLHVDGEKAGFVQDVPFNAGASGRTFTIGAKIRNESRATIQEWEGEIDEWKFEPSTVADPINMSVPQPSSSQIRPPAGS